MANVVRWEDFDKIHVVRRLRELIAKWWRVQINFTDEKGFLRGVPDGKFFNPLNEVCRKFTDSPKGYAQCIGTVRNTTVEARSTHSKNMGMCHAGFSTLSVPIEIEGRYLGCVFGDGFILEETQSKQIVLIKNTFSRFFDNIEHLDQWIETIPILSEKDVSNLKELIHMVVEEILQAQVHINQAAEALGCALAVIWRNTGGIKRMEEAL